MRLFRRHRPPMETLTRTHEQWAGIISVLLESDVDAALVIHRAAHPCGYCERPDLLQTVWLPPDVHAAAVAAEPEAQARRLAERQALDARLTAESAARFVLEADQRTEGGIISPLSRRAPLLEDLLALSPGEFEDEVARLLESQGYRDVQRVGGAGDLGVDIVCRDDAGNLVAVQCKRYAPDNPIRSPAMQTFYGMVVRRRAQRGLYVTTSRFTDAARKLAEDVDIEIVDGLELVRQLSADALHPGHDPASLAARWNDQRTRDPDAAAGVRICQRCLVAIGSTDDRCPQCFRRW